MNKRLLVILLTAFLWAGAAAKDYQAIKNGIKPDGKTLNTVVLQQLIDKVSLSGGGRIVFTEGTYLTGSLTLRSGVELHFEKNATLLGSTNPNHYYKLTEFVDTSVKQDNSMLALIMAEGQKDIAITGYGMIDGQGRQLALNIDSIMGRRPNELARPKLLLFKNCQDITLKQMNMRNSACWGLSFELCQDMTIDSLNIVNRAYWNNDGIDLSDCHRVSISNCRIDSADDGICLKSYHADNFNDQINISHCELRTSASAIKFGTASYGGFKNVTIHDIRVFDTFRSAIALECVDGGVMENIKVSHITALNTGNAIFIRLGHRAGKQPGKIKGIHLSDMTIAVPFECPDYDYDVRGPAVGGTHNPLPSSITGIPEHMVEDVTLERINLIMPGRASRAVSYLPQNRLNKVPEKIKDYPEFTMFGDLPAWAFYVRHVRGISFKDIHLSLYKDDFRPAFILEDVHQVSFDKLSLPLGKSIEKQIVEVK